MSVVESEPPNLDATELDSHSQETIQTPEITETTLFGLPEQVCKKFETARQRPDVSAACSEYLDENLSALDDIEQNAEKLEIIERVGDLETEIGVVVTQEHLDEVIQSIRDAVVDSGEYKALVSQSDELHVLENKQREIQRVRASSAPKDLNGIRQSAKIMGISVNSFLFKLSGGYRRKLQSKITDTEAQNDTRARELSIASSRSGSTDTSASQLRDGADTRQLEIPQVDMAHPEQYIDSCKNALDEYTAHLLAAIETPDKLDLASEIVGQLRVHHTPEARERFIDNYIHTWVGSSLKKAGITYDALNNTVQSPILKVGDLGLKKARRELANAMYTIGTRIFIESSLPAYYLHTHMDQDTRMRLRKASYEVNKSKKHVKYYEGYKNQDLNDINLEDQLALAAEQFTAAIERGSDLYWHATPVLDLIIEAGELSPRVDVDESKRVTSTGAHSKGVHFMRETLVGLYAGYSQVRNKPDKLRRSMSSKDAESTGRDLIFTVFPSTVVAKHSPYRYEPGGSTLPSKTDNPNARTVTSEDTVFWGDIKEADAFNYDYPLIDGYIVVAETDRDWAAGMLRDRGMDEWWIKSHVIAIPSEVLNKTRKTTLDASGRVSSINGREVYHDGSLKDKRTGGELHLSSVYDRVVAYATGRIKEQLDPQTIVVPLRVFSVQRFESVDVGIGTRSKRVGSKLGSSAKGDETVEQLAVI